MLTTYFGVPPLFAFPNCSPQLFAARSCQPKEDRLKINRVLKASPLDTGLVTSSKNGHERHVDQKKNRQSMLRCHLGTKQDV